MNLMPEGPGAGNDNDDYLVNRWQAWLAFAMAFRTATTFS